jgi:hypothetical protein
VRLPDFVAPANTPQGQTQREHYASLGIDLDAQPKAAPQAKRSYAESLMS